MVDQDFLQGLSDLPQAVFIVTLFRDDGRPHGFTATSVTSVSVDPASLVVFVNRANAGADIVEPSKPMALHVLGRDQEELSNRFAGRAGVSGPEKFNGVEWTERYDVPVLAESSDVFVGPIERVEPYHDHLMVGVQVEDVINRDRVPLVYRAERYLKVQLEQNDGDS